MNHALISRIIQEIKNKIMCILNRLLIDIVEIIIVETRNHDILKKINEILPKLDNNNIYIRIENKLCCTKYYKNSAELEIITALRIFPSYAVYHSVYDNPCVICCDRSELKLEWYYKNIHRRRNNLPYYIHSNGSRKCSNFSSNCILDYIIFNKMTSMKLINDTKYLRRINTHGIRLFEIENNEYKTCVFDFI